VSFRTNGEFEFDGEPPQQQTCTQAGGDCYANSCGNYANCNTVFGTCTGGQTCCSGSCAACTTHDHSDCYNGDRYWYDSCNNLEDIREDCSGSCSGDTCQTSQFHPADDNQDGCIDIGELAVYVAEWKSGGPTMSQLLDAITLWKSGVGCTALACSEGAISSTCTCGGSEHSTGYCCSGAWQSGSCGSGYPACANGAVTIPCECGAIVIFDSYCCDGSHYSVPC